MKLNYRFVETVLNSIAILRPYWKSLQLLNDDDSIKLNDYLVNWDTKYRKDVKFDDLVNREKKFPLTGFYPLYSNDENIKLDKEIDHLIETTDLSVPENRTLVVASENNLNWNKNFSDIQTIATNDSLTTLVENIGSRKVI
jgi:hypothetical protein